MKKLILFLLIPILLFSVLKSVPADAQEEQMASPSASGKSTKTQEEKIQDLKERLATKVAELRQNQKGIVAGRIKDKSDTHFTLVTKKEEMAVTYSAEDTIVEELALGKRSEKKVSDLTNSIFINVFGLVDSEKKTIDAKYNLIKKPLAMLSGIVVEKDTSEATIKVKTNQNELYTFDYEKDTKTTLWTPGEGLVKSGLSKISESDRIHVLGSPVAGSGEEKKISAVRILHIPLSTFEKVEATPSATPVAGASATPKATVKPTPIPK